MLNIVKGFRRLVLTAGLLCGVGLFLCPVEAKAAITDVTATAAMNSGNLVITLTNTHVSAPVTIVKADVVSDGKTFNLLSEVPSGITLAAGANQPITVTKEELVKTDNPFVSLFTPNPVKITFSSGNIVLTDDTNATHTPTIPATDVTSVFSIEAKHPADGTSVSPTYTVKVGAAERSYTNTGYGIDGESFSIKSAVDASAYYERSYETSESVSDTGFYSTTGKWSDAGTTGVSGTIATSDIIKNFAYVPKISSVAVKSSTTGFKNPYIFYFDADVAAERTKSYTLNKLVDTDITYAASSEAGKDFFKKYTWDTTFDNDNSSFSSFALSATNISGSDVTVTLGNATNMLTTGVYAGIGRTKLSATLGGDKKTENLGVVEVKAYQEVDGVKLNADDFYATGQPQDFYIAGLVPAGIADTNLANYTIKTVAEDPPTPSAAILSAISYDAANKKITLTPKTGITGGTTSIKVAIEHKDPTDPTIIYSFNINVPIKVISVNATKTKEEINKGIYNFITSGYEFDVASMIRDLAVYDGTAPATRLTPDTIDFDDSSSTNYAEWVDSAHTKLKGKAAGTVKIKCNLGGVALSGIEVKVYPVPVVKYNSDRTVSVDVPGKASVGYRSDSAVKSGTGFKLILTDGSGNALYSENTKFQNVISSPKDYYTTYTVSKSDIESMVTNAASNGKFNAETTSVKFKAIPMGKKYSDDSTITTDERIYGTADTTVYRVTANANSQQFDVSYAYGLDGQTVNLTANPKSGYTFKSWQDNGSTSNPRQITISGSGTRSFSAVAGDRVDPNGPGANGGNSSLYDDVPKTAEGNGAIFLIIFMVFAVMGTVYALYIQLKAATNKNNDK